MKEASHSNSKPYKVIANIIMRETAELFDAHITDSKDTKYSFFLNIVVSMPLKKKMQMEHNKRNLH